MSTPGSGLSTGGGPSTVPKPPVSGALGGGQGLLAPGVAGAVAASGSNPDKEEEKKTEPDDNTSSNNNTTNNSSTSNNNNNNNPVVLREDAGETPPTKDHRRPPVAVWTLFRASTACPWAYRPVGVATAARLLPDLLLAGVRNHNRTDG
mmetsp:Transcript_20293/g.42910  ORF Transcript_20293/g.42910 Transcript_20293/m.42910 type:complete len:149 (-) Transcript_20293:761-1207(-)